MTKTILVTGGTGLVGSAVKEMSSKNDDSFPSLDINSQDPKDNFIFVNSKDYDLSSWEDTTRMFEKYKPTHVIHLAACVGGLFKNMNNKVNMLERKFNDELQCSKMLSSIPSHKIGCMSLYLCFSRQNNISN